MRYDAPMDEAPFRQAVSAALRNLAKQVDGIDRDDFDSRLSDGVFQVDFEAGGTFVLSQQVPTRELWLSANSRAWHFRLEGPDWLERDTSERLDAVLTSLFSGKLGQPIRIVNPGPM